MCSKLFLTIVVPILWLLIMVEGENQPPDIAVKRVNKLSDQIRLILEHYKNPDAVGLPGAPVPDPMKVEDMESSVLMVKIKIVNATVVGLSKFQIQHVQSNLANLEAEVIVYIKQLEILGNYTLKTWLQSSKGPCNITLSEVYLKGLAKVEVARMGNLETSEIGIDIDVDSILMNFENLGGFASMFQSTLNTLGTFILDSVKPFIIGVYNNEMRQTVNKQLLTLNLTFPNSIPPIDIAIAEGRKAVQKMGYDPYKVDDYHYSLGIVSFDVKNVYLKGIATFYRIGNLTIIMENNTIHVELEVGTQQMKGNCEWEITSLGYITKNGKTSFTVEYLNVKAKFNQSLDIRQQPILDDLKLDLGNIQLRIDGTGTLDYVLEAAVNILPNVLRYQIMDGVEGPLRRKLQDILDSYNFESMIEENLSKLDHLNEDKTKGDDPKKELLEKLSEEGITVDESQLDSDDIFN